METNKNFIDDLPETILTEILAKFPIKNITTFKLVCKRWKSLVESVLFHNVFVSNHQKSSCSWSLLQKFRFNYNTPRDELIAFYGCERWGLPRSLGSYMSPPFLDSGIEIASFIIKTTASGLLLVLTLNHMYYVVNPLSRECVKIRPCTLSLKDYFHSNKIGLATRVDENGVVLEYKVVLVNTCFKEATSLALQVYSSRTGEWSYENIRCPYPIPWSSFPYFEPISLNGMLHCVEPGEDHYFGEDAGGIVAIDLYNAREDNQCWLIPFPDENLRFCMKDGYKIWSRRACTTSGGFIMYINMVSKSKMKIWRLKKDYYAIELGEYWLLSREIDLEHVEHGLGSVPMVMHPFDTDLVYLWSLEKSCLVSINLRKQNSTLHKESENDCCGCIMSSLEKCKSFMDKTFRSTHDESLERGLFHSPQFVPSPWMDSVPRPPFPPCVCCGR